MIENMLLVKWIKKRYPLLSPASHDAPWFEATELAHRSERCYKAGRFRFGTCLRYPHSCVHPWGCHPLVQSTWGSARCTKILVRHWYLEYWMHLFWDGNSTTLVPWWLGNRSALQDFQVISNKEVYRASRILVVKQNFVYYSIEFWAHRMKRLGQVFRTYQITSHPFQCGEETA